MNIDLFYLAKLKQAGMSDEQVALKLGITLKDVRAALAEIKRITDAPPTNGEADLRLTANNLTNEFRNMGKSLSIFISGALDSMGIDELTSLIASISELKEDSARDLAAKLSSSAIVLKPFVLPDMQQMMKDIERESKGPSRN